MRCNYFAYMDMTKKLFDGVPLTEKHLNDATEQIRQYLLNGGAGPVLAALQIGIQVVTKENLLCSELVKRRFVWLDGECKGRELTLNEISNIGLFLQHGPLYGKCGVPCVGADKKTMIIERNWQTWKNWYTWTADADTFILGFDGGVDDDGDEYTLTCEYHIADDEVVFERLYEDCHMETSLTPTDKRHLEERVKRLYHIL